jgi:molecular chaperone HscB
VDLQTESNTSMPAEFLMTQMAWREALDELREESDAERRSRSKAALRQAVDQFWQSGEARLVTLLSGHADPKALAEAADLVRQLMFVKKFEQELLES